MTLSRARLPLAALVLVALPAAAAPRFKKVSEHYYVLTAPEGNVGALVTGDGVLLVDPPADGAAALAALAPLTAAPIRWVVRSASRAGTGGCEYFQARGAALLAGRSPAAQPGAPAAEKSPAWRLEFGRQLHLFPGGVEVQVVGFQKAQAAAAEAVVLPAERVLHAGDLFAPRSFPEVDEAGSALGWLEAARALLEAVPLVRSAMPQPRAPLPPAAAPAAAKGPPGAAPPEERPIEETVVLVGLRGPVATLADLKELVETAQKLRGEVAHAVAAGRNRDAFLAALAAPPYRDYKGLEAFAARLFTELARK